MFLEDMKISANVGADDTGMHPLHLTAATHARRWDIMDLLLSFGADIKARDNQGRLPLHTAAMGDRHQAVELLLKKGGRPERLPRRWPQRSWADGLERDVAREL